MAGGAKDNASDYESGNCSFEKRLARKLSFYSHNVGETEQDNLGDRH